MMDKMRLAVIGGDLRSIMLAKMLRGDGNYVKTYGLKLANDNDLSDEFSLEEAVKDCDIVIGPIPCTEDNIHIRTPFGDSLITFEELFSAMSTSQFIAGRTKEISALGARYGKEVIDLLEREDMAVQNAVPTAEGAIQIAMEKTPHTLNGSNCLVLGYGRIGKILAKMLDGIGANTSVAARKYADLAWIERMGYIPMQFSELRDGLSDIDVVFNTVPRTVIGENELMQMKKTCLIIDLASKPGGVDFKRAEAMGINTVWALSLPGKVAPVSAAKIMRNTIYNIVEETRGRNAF